MATKDNTLKTASVLAFERKLDPSDAQFFAGKWDDRQSSTAWAPVTLREKSVRGTISNRLAAGELDAAKLNAKIEDPNLQRVDVAALPADADTLKVMFTLRVLGGTGTPSACNNADYQTKLLNTVKGYADSQGFGELGQRYAHNLANARFLWRNRVGAEQVEVQIQHLVKGQPATTWTFDSLQLSTRDFNVPEAAKGDLQGLADLIAQGLEGTSHVLLRVTSHARIGAGQEVYPSQELILKDQKGDEGGKKGKKSKTLYHVQGVAGIHSQKIGNALRTIDTWHPDVSDLGPIAVEPYGSITTLARACRNTGGQDFYALLDGWLLKDRVPPLEQQHFVMATLIRGGVFGKAEKPEKE